MPSYRFICKKCFRENLKHLSTEQFEKKHDAGFSCPNCGWPRMQTVRSNYMVKDGFEAGFQENIGMYVSDKKTYEQILKERGLVEIGYDYIPTESKDTINPASSLEFALHAKDIGVDLSDREVDAIASGEFFKTFKSN